MKRYAPQCKNCQHCKQIGKTSGKFSTNNTSRKTYYCEHPYIRDIHDKYGQPIYPFIGFGDTTVKSPLVLKNRKRWCPIVRLLDGLDNAFTESVNLHIEWMHTPEGSAERDAAKKTWMQAHLKYCKAIDALRASDPDAADAWKPPTRR